MQLRHAYRVLAAHIQSLACFAKSAGRRRSPTKLAQRVLRHSNVLLGLHVLGQVVQRIRNANDAQQVR